ncbi:MAG TPA: alpha/beta fold hydrolase [Gammaproteobacteria bacterium]|nr:alpha/beta fold hydrolase [Gammaproteobacteria bacterium]
MKETPTPSHPCDEQTYPGQVFDRALHATASQFIGYISPAAMRLAWIDWLFHLAICPAKQLDLMQTTLKSIQEFSLFMHESQNKQGCPPNALCRENDKRFNSAAWNEFPFNVYAQGFLLMDHLWGECTQGIQGIDPHHRHFVDFFGRQFLDIFSPSNFPWTNPDVIAKTTQEQGQNLIRGFHNLLEDFTRHQKGSGPIGTEQFQVGKNVAITPGKVVYRNRLIELIQYQPTTSEVYPEPILITPAWIMKYYILDLSPHNSLVKYLVSQGHTVFMISWKNPTSEDRDLSLEDYVNLGIMSALTVINAIVPDKKIHATGYCLGGTLLMMAAAAMAGLQDDRLKTINLFAAQIDFENAGEILLFVDESQISYIEDIMWEKGYLDGAQMGGAFSMLHSTDLIWSRMIVNYLMGERETLNDLMAWDADTTRMPYTMHSQYLRKLFLNNDLVQGRFKINGENVLLPDVEAPMFVVSTTKDHVAPWKSVYKIHFFTDTNVTFVLTSGGHNAGIISEPGHPNRSYKMLSHIDTHLHLTPEEWEASTPDREGSWWSEWSTWLAAHSGEKMAPPAIGTAEYTVLCDAPGTYVLQK